MAEPILDLNTLVERPKIKIDGEVYEILSPEELSVVDHQRFGIWGRRIDALMAKPKTTAAEQKELAQILGDLTDRILVGVPEELREKLSDTHRLEVAEVFIRLPLQRRLNRLAAAGAAGAADGAALTGESSPPASSASTAGRRAGGSRKRRSPSSASTRS